MQLIGMLDSPYVRRVAITLQLLGPRFERRSISVFSTFKQFHAINPVVKAPTLVCDDGTVLMDPPSSSTAVAWFFTQMPLPDLVRARALPEAMRVLSPGRAVGGVHGAATW